MESLLEFGLEPGARRSPVRAISPKKGRGGSSYEMPEPEAPRLELEAGPSFSQLFDGMRLSQDTSTLDLTHDIENYMDLKAVLPEWEDDDIQEIIVMSRKDRLPTISEEGRDMPISRRTTGKRNTLRVPIPAAPSPPPPPASKASFEMVAVLGNGTTARVSVCRKDNALYAMKTMHKATLFVEECVDHACWEQRCLQRITEMQSRPFLPSLYWSFQDEESVHLVMDFYPCGDLLTHLTQSGAFHPKRALFYASELAEGISRLHSVGIVHRDLKPENILVDIQGHIVITDFGCSKILVPSYTMSPTTPRSSTPCGTREYQSPEMMMGWTHDFAVDCWGFGVLLYLMVFGTHPFMVRDEANNPVGLKDNILHAPINLPLHHREWTAQDLITKASSCLERNSSLRLGIQDIKRHTYFKNVDWMQVSIKTIPVPLVPELDEDRLDLRYFDKDFTNIDPYHYRESPLHREVVNSSNYYSRMDTPFEDFDFTMSKSQAVGVSPMVVPPHMFHHDLQPTVLARAYSNDVRQSHEETEDMWDGERPMLEKIDPAMFWDSIDLGNDDNTVSSSTTIDLLEILQQRPTNKKGEVWSLVSNLIPVNNLRKKSKPSAIPAPQADLELPNGIEQVGSGIGYTYNLTPGAWSKASICTSAPRKCHGFSIPGFGLGQRKVPPQPKPAHLAPWLDDTEQVATKVDRKEEVAAMRDILGIENWSLRDAAMRVGMAREAADEDEADLPEPSQTSSLPPTHELSPTLPLYIQSPLSIDTSIYNFPSSVANTPALDFSSPAFSSSMAYTHALDVSSPGFTIDIPPLDLSPIPSALHSPDSLIYLATPESLFYSDTHARPRDANDPETTLRLVTPAGYEMRLPGFSLSPRLGDGPARFPDTGFELTRGLLLSNAQKPRRDVQRRPVTTLF